MKFISVEKILAQYESNDSVRFPNWHNKINVKGKCLMLAGLAVHFEASGFKLDARIKRTEFSQSHDYGWITIDQSAKNVILVKSPYPATNTTNVEAFMESETEPVNIVGIKAGEGFRFTEKSDDSDELAQAKRPPLGIIPEKLWLETRYDDLKRAIRARLGEDESVPDVWIAEYNKLQKTLWP